MEILIRDEGITVGLLHKEHAVYIRTTDEEDYEAIRKILRIAIKSFALKTENNDKKMSIKIVTKGNGYKEIGAILQQAFGF